MQFAHERYSNSKKALHYFVSCLSLVAFCSFSAATPVYALDGYASDQLIAQAEADDGAYPEAEEDGEMVEEYSYGGSSESGGLPPVSGEGGVGLASVFVGLIGTALLLSAAISVFLGFSALFCASVWHGGKMLRGGRKPSIG